MKCLAFVDCDCRGQMVFLQTCPCEGKPAVGQNPNAQYFRCATHAAVAWSVDPALSAVPNKPGNPRSLFSLSFPLQDRPLAFSFLFFSQYFHFSVYHHLSLIPPSLHTDLLFNWPVYASLHALQSQKGDKGESESIGLCYCWDCCCLGIISSTAAPPFLWHCGSHCTGVSKLTKQVTTLASQIEVIINSVMRLLALLALAYFTQHTLVARISFIATASINQLG